MDPRGIATAEAAARTGKRRRLSWRLNLEEGLSLKEDELVSGKERERLETCAHALKSDELHPLSRLTQRRNRGSLGGCCRA